MDAAEAGLFRRGRGRADAARLHRLPRSAEGDRRARRSPRSRSKGVQVKILTGDNEIVTRKICHEVELDAGEILLGGSDGRDERRGARRGRRPDDACSPS